MSTDSSFQSPFQGFSKLNREERLARLMQMGALTQEDIFFLQSSVDTKITSLAEKFVENVVGCFPLPLGVATDFHIDGKDYLIPMAVEETSIIAAASKTARWVRQTGSITTSIQGRCIIGQVHFPEINDFDALNQAILIHKNQLISELNQSVAKGLFQRGGGVQDLVLRQILLSRQSIPFEFQGAGEALVGEREGVYTKYMTERKSHEQQSQNLKGEGYRMAVLHVLLDPCDAMGANIVSQVCEALKPSLQAITGERIGLCILSNLVDTRLTQVNLVIREIDPGLGQAIAEASLFACVDPYRAATHNKGVLNGIDPVLIATGNDWRAVEAGIHAYASSQGNYQPITRWEMQGNELHGVFKAPVIVGTVGGVTRLHPTAQLCLRLLGIGDAQTLSRVIAAVGLVQNLGALRALSTEGICQGHMKLHIDNLLLAAQAKSHQFSAARDHLTRVLQQKKTISVADAQQVLASMET